MERYSHKDILNEGISNLLRKGIAGAARVAAAAGGAVKAGAQQGAKADIVSLGRGARQGYRDEARKQRRLKKRPKPKPKPKAKEHFSDNVKKALSNIKDEKPVKKEEPGFKPKVGDEVLVRTKKVPTGEPGVVKRLNPGGRITVSTAGNKTGYAFNPKNVIPSPRVKNESISQINLLRQLTLLS